MAPLSSPVTIVTPTFERFYFLERKLYHMALQKCRHPILILDSSDGESTERNRAIVEKFSNEISIDYRHFGTKVHFAEKLAAGIESIETPFAVCSWDDDFLNLKTVEDGIAFLADNGDYATSSGIVLNFIKTAATLENIGRLPIIGKGDLFDDPDPHVRMRKFLASSRKRNSLFSVWRTEFLKETIRPVSLAPWRKYNEILFDHAAIYAGPTRACDGILEIRHTSYGKAKYRNNSMPNFTNTFSQDLLDGAFTPMLNAMADLFVKYLRRVDRRDDAALKQIVVDNFLRHRLPATLRRLKEPRAKTSYEWLGSSAAIRGLKRIRGWLRYALLLSQPRRLRRFLAVYKLYGRSLSVAMLQTDPDLEYNYATLTSPDSPHYAFLSTVYKTLEKYPERGVS